MSKISELLVEMIEDVKNSVDLFGIEPDKVSADDVSPSMAYDWANWHFENRKSKTPEDDVQLYLSWFRNTNKYLKEQNSVALSWDETFNVEDK